MSKTLDEASKMAATFIKAVAGKDGVVTLDELKNANKASTGTWNPVDGIVYGQMGDLLSKFAKENEAYLKQHPEMLTRENLQKVADSLIAKGDKDQDGSISVSEGLALSKMSIKPQDLNVADNAKKAGKSHDVASR